MEVGGQAGCRGGVISKGVREDGLRAVSADNEETETAKYVGKRDCPCPLWSPPMARVWLLWVSQQTGQTTARPREAGLRAAADPSPKPPPPPADTLP